MSSPGTTALLERTADEVVVLAPPVEPMLAEADRLRRRRRTAVGGAVLAVLVTLGAADAVTSFVDPDPEAWPAATPPDGMRFVGIGRAVIAVPTGWATDATRCGQPVRDTVVIGTAPAATCTAPRPADIRSVVITAGPPAAGFRAESTYDVAGHRGRARPHDLPGGDLHRGGAPADGERHLHRRVLEPPTRAGPRRGGRAWCAASGCWTAASRCPAPGALAADYGRSAEAKYVADLRDLGLDPVVEPDTTTGADPGTVTAVSPEPGTPLTPGSEVTVRVADGARSARDLVAVGIGSVDDDRTYRGLTARGHPPRRDARGAAGHRHLGVRRRPPVADPGRAPGRARRSRSTSGATDPTGRPRGRR